MDVDLPSLLTKKPRTSRTDLHYDARWNSFGKESALSENPIATKERLVSKRRCSRFYSFVAHKNQSEEQAQNFSKMETASQQHPCISIVEVS